MRSSVKRMSRLGWGSLVRLRLSGLRRRLRLRRVSVRQPSQSIGRLSLLLTLTRK